MKRCILIFAMFIMSQPCLASKCAKPTSLAELIRDFPVVIRGKVVDRQRVVGGDSVFFLRVTVEKVLKGKFGVKDIIVNEKHGVTRWGSWSSYEVGKSFIFPIIVEKGVPQIILPPLGCETLPKGE